MKKMLIIVVGFFLIACSSEQGVTKKGFAMSSNSEESPLITKHIRGKPDMRYFEAEKRVAKRWGVNIKHQFGGCMVTPEKSKEQKAVEDKNKEAYLYYDKKFGKDWQTKFKEEVKEERGKR